MYLRQQGVADTRVLSAIERTPREWFLPEMFHDRAYEDEALPIGHGQTISQPLIVARMTQALELSNRHKVLEIGTGSGYQAAILAHLAYQVFTIERYRPLLATARTRFARLGLANIAARAADGTKGWPGQFFDRIIVTAACGQQDPPPLLVEQLTLGGIMILPIGYDRPDQRLVKLRRLRHGVEWQDLWPVRFVPLVIEEQNHAIF
jgi:protein-L-isoaspartate(D-aspartate) O-methyltransferase